VAASTSETSVVILGLAQREARLLTENDIAAAEGNRQSILASP